MNDNIQENRPENSMISTSDRVLYLNFVFSESSFILHLQFQQRLKLNVTFSSCRLEIIFENQLRM